MIDDGSLYEYDVVGLKYVVRATEYAKSQVDGVTEIYPFIDGFQVPVESAIGRQMYARNELGDEYYPVIARDAYYREHCLRDEHGKLYYARRANGEPVYPRDHDGMLYVIRDGGGAPQFPSDATSPPVVGYRHLNHEFEADYYVTVPFDENGFATGVGELYLEAMTGSGGVNWQPPEVPFSKSPHPGVYERNGGDLFTFVGDREYDVEIAPSGEVFPYEIVKNAKRYFVTVAGIRVYHSSLDDDDRSYFVYDGRMHSVFSLWDDSLVLYEKTPVEGRVRLYKLDLASRKKVVKDDLKLPNEFRVLRHQQISDRSILNVYSDPKRVITMVFDEKKAQLDVRREPEEEEEEDEEEELEESEPPSPPESEPPSPPPVLRPVNLRAAFSSKPISFVRRHATVIVSVLLLAVALLVAFAVFLTI